MLERAIEVARGNTIKKLPKMGAILLTKGGNVYYGINRYRTHPLQKKFGRNRNSVYLHAEIDAIVKAMRYEKSIMGARLYVARVLKNGRPALAKPCPGCQRAIMAFRIGKVEWTE